MLASDAHVSVGRVGGVLTFLPTSRTGRSGLAFIAGAGVAPEAYGPMLRPIAAAGHAVHVVGLPYRIAPLERDKAATAARAREIIETDTAAASWVLGGHSLGGAIACRLAAAAPSRLKEIVLIGTSHPKRVDLSRASVPITKILASRDGIATPQMTQATRHLLRADSRWIEIEGGNHSQFGCYGRQLFDGRAAISREEQQAVTRDVLLEALRR